MAEATTQTEQLNKAIMEKEGKYLTFALGPEEYGLEILKVREIIGYMDITAVPQTPVHVKGVINLRGQVIPVIDLRAKFGMKTAEVTEQTCIIVVETTQEGREFQTGIVVDHVSEVLDIDGENIEKSPQFGASVDTSFILGMGKIGESVKILLDIDKVLSSTDLSSFAGVNDNQPTSSPEPETQQDESQTEQAKEPEQSAESEQAQQEEPQDANAGDTPQ
ncbi:MAG: chemotaxis protein CheW [Planctomycetota bacterium]|nr:MAG: chemotaxis protein CheW [Planctomycetota bacterium]